MTNFTQSTKKVSSAPTLGSRYVRVPLALITSQHARPRLAGLYGAIMRLCEIVRGPVEVSRNELARWFGADHRDEMPGLEQDLQTLRGLGYLDWTTGASNKRIYTPGWGYTIKTQFRPWTIARADRGLPARTTTKRLPVALLDYYIGRLIIAPDPRNPAVVERYIVRPLLTPSELGSYLLAQTSTPISRAHLSANVRLTALGLLTPSGIAEPLGRNALLTAISAGGVHNDDETPAQLSAAGTAVLQRIRPGRATTSPTTSNLDPIQALDGSNCDPLPSDVGSDAGSNTQSEDYAPLCGETPLFLPKSAAWDSDRRINEGDPPLPPPTLGEKGRGGSPSLTIDVSNNTHQPPDLHLSPPVDYNNHDLADCEEYHKNQLAIHLRHGHAALNPTRSIPRIEWVMLAGLQATYGVEMLQQWQLRAASAKRTEIRLAYYATCALTQKNAPPVSCGNKRTLLPPLLLDAARTELLARLERATGDTCSHPQLLHSVACDRLTAVVMQAEATTGYGIGYYINMARADSPFPGPHVDSALAVTPATPAAVTPAAAPAVISDDHAALIANLEAIFADTIRYPQVLASCPVTLLRRWVAVAAHPGFRTRSTPLGYIVNGVKDGKEPPTRDELRAWAERGGMSSYDPRLTAWHPPSSAFVSEAAEGNINLTEILAEGDVPIPPRDPLDVVRDTWAALLARGVNLPPLAGAADDTLIVFDVADDQAVATVLTVLPELRAQLAAQSARVPELRVQVQNDKARTDVSLAALWQTARADLRLCLPRTLWQQLGDVALMAWSEGVMHIATHRQDLKAQLENYQTAIGAVLTEMMNAPVTVRLRVRHPPPS